jgi:hypothetical protein
MDRHERTVRMFWRLFNDAEFDKAGSMLSPDCIVRWPNTRELFDDRAKFIAANKQYPGRWRIDVEKLFVVASTVITVVRVFNEEGNNGFYATSFFTFENDLITEITEYWGDITDPPDWRVKKGLSERY